MSTSGYYFLILNFLFLNPLFSWEALGQEECSTSTTLGTVACSSLNGNYSMQIIETKGSGCSYNNLQGLEYLSFIHEYESSSNTVSITGAHAGNANTYFVVADINRSTDINGTVLDDDLFEVTFCSGTTLNITRDYFPSDDPNTQQNEESYIPYQSGGVRQYNNGTFIGFMVHPTRTGPNITKSTLPAGTVEVHVTVGNNGWDRKVEYRFYGVCSYEVDVTETAMAQCHASLETSPGVFEVVPVGAINQQNITLECSRKDFCRPKLLSTQCSQVHDPNNGSFTVTGIIPNAEDVMLRFVNKWDNTDIQTHSYGHSTSVFNKSDFNLIPNNDYWVDARVKIDGEWRSWGDLCWVSIKLMTTAMIDEVHCNTTIGPNAYPFMVHTPADPNNYFELEMVIDGNGNTQTSHLGYFSYSPSNTHTYVSLSNFYLWDGYYTSYVKSRASGQNWDIGPLCSFNYNSSITRRTRGDNGVPQQVTSRIYPNPSDEAGFNIELSGLNETSNNVLVNIYDLLGKEVHTELRNGGGVNQIIHLNEDGTLQAGFYLVSIEVNGKTFNEKIQVK